MTFCCKKNAMEEDCRCNAGVDEPAEGEAQARIAELEAQLAEAVEALRPFATAMEWALEGTTSQTLGTIEAVAKYHLVGGSFNRARAFLATLTGDKTDE